MTRILLADDNHKLLKALTRELELRGYMVQQARNGPELFSQLRSADYLPDIIVSDHTMPDMDEAMLRQQLQNNPAWCSIPLLLLVAFNGWDASQIGQTQQLTDYIVKPFPTDALVEAIQRKLSSNHKPSSKI